MARWLKYTLWCAATLLLAAAGAECALRLWRPAGLRQDLLDCHRFINDEVTRADPDLGFRLKPGVTMRGFHHNAHGFAGPEFATPKPEGLLRIVCLGGSTTLGAGVPADRYSYPAQLQAMLDRTTPGKRTVEVINGGVFGYHSLHAAIQASSKLARFQPDLYVVMEGLNDLDTARNLTLDKLQALQNTGGLALEPHGSRLLTALEGLAAAPPWKAQDGQGMPGLEAKFTLLRMGRNLDAVIAAARSQGAGMLLVADPFRRGPQGTPPSAGMDKDMATLFAYGRMAVPEIMADAAQRGGVPFLGVQPLFDDVLGDMAAERRVFDDDIHLTRYGYHMLAGQVYRALMEMPQVRQAVDGAAPLPQAELDAATPGVITWRPADGSGWPEGGAPSVGGITGMEGLKRTPQASDRGFTVLTPEDPRQQGVVRMRVRGGCLRLYPRLQTAGDAVHVELNGPDGPQEVFALVKDVDDGLWSPEADWFSLRLPEGQDVDVMVRLRGANAQLWTRGPEALFPCPEQAR